jgi:hypothetical protein
VLLPGPDSSSSSSTLAAALLTASEDGTLRSTVLHEQPQQPVELTTHLLGAHASGAAVRCLDARRLAGQSDSWLVVAGCAKELLLAWQVGWQQQQQPSLEGVPAPDAAQLAWQLLGSLNPQQGRRSKTLPPGVTKASIEPRYLAVCIVSAAAAPSPGQACQGQTSAVIAAAASDGWVKLLRLALPQGTWSILAVLQPGSSSVSSSVSDSRHAHPVLSLASVQLPAAGEAAATAAAQEQHVLAAGTTDGRVLLYAVGGVVAAAAASSASSSDSSGSAGVLQLQPLLELPGLHQSGVNALQLVVLAQAPRRLLLVTAGDDQALAVTELCAAEVSQAVAESLAAAAAAGAAVCEGVCKPSAPSGRLCLQQAGSIKQANAHASALRRVSSTDSIKPATSGADAATPGGTTAGLPPIDRGRLSGARTQHARSASAPPPNTAAAAAADGSSRKKRRNLSPAAGASAKAATHATPGGAHPRPRDSPREQEEEQSHVSKKLF